MTSPTYSTPDEARAACLKASKGKTCHIHEVKPDCAYVIKLGGTECKCDEIFGEIYDAGSQDSIFTWSEDIATSIPCINWESGLLTYTDRELGIITLPEAEGMERITTSDLPAPIMGEPIPEPSPKEIELYIRASYFTTFHAACAVVEGEVEWPEIENTVWIKTPTSTTRIMCVRWGENGAPVVIWYTDGIGDYKKGEYVSYLDDRRYKVEKLNKRKKYGNR